LRFVDSSTLRPTSFHQRDKGRKIVTELDLLRGIDGNSRRIVCGWYFERI
jgi:hypothetical protein